MDEGGGEMSKERDELISILNISLSDDRSQITEKLFCAALTTTDTYTIEKVLKEYHRLKSILKGG